jgi:hypothetical protein
MSESIQQVISDGTLVSLDVSIPYIDQEDMFFYVDEVLAAPTYTVAWVTATQISISPAIPLGAEFTVRRRTKSAEALHVFGVGNAVFSDVAVDENFRQVLYIAQEAKEGGSVTDYFTDIDMHNNRITNAGDAVDPQDYVTKAQADVLYNSPLQQGTRSTRTFTATAGQTVINTVFAYIPDTNTVAVIVNGLVLVPVEDYTETSATVITLLSALASGDSIVIEFFGSTLASVDSQNASFLQNGVGAGSRTVASKLQETVDYDDFIGATDDIKLAAAITALNNTGKVLLMPSRVINLTQVTPAIVGMRIQGKGTYDWQLNTRWGSVFSLTGTLETTSANAFTISDGASIEGCVFYYPSQIPNVLTPAITPSGYTVLLRGAVTRRGSSFKSNWIVNGYNCVKNDDGTSHISNNWICGLGTCIANSMSATETVIAHNSLGFVNWYGSIGKTIRDYIGANAVAFRLTSGALEGSAATMTGNNVFGFYIGLLIEGNFGFLSINGGIMDGCRFNIYGGAGNTGGTLRVTGAYLASNTVVFGTNSNSPAVTLESNVLRWLDPAAECTIEFNNCVIGGANADLLYVAAPTNIVNLILNGNHIKNPGRFNATKLITVTSPSGTYVNPETVTGLTSGATATFLKNEAGVLYLSEIVGTFVVAETIRGNTTLATSTVSIINDGTLWSALKYDCPTGNVTISGNYFSFARYMYNRGLRFVDVNIAAITGNTFRSPFTESSYMITVSNAQGFIEAGNISSCIGITPDVIVSACTAEPNIGLSAWSRVAAAPSDYRSRFLAASAAAQTTSGTTVLTLVNGTESFDQRSEYNPVTGIFTAAYGGLMDFSAAVAIASGTVVGDVFAVSLITPKRTIRTLCTLYSLVATAIQIDANGFVMSAGDTATLSIQRITGTGTITTSTVGAYFSGLRRK